MLIHWAGADSDVIVALTRDISPNILSTSSVFISYDYGSSFVNKQPNMIIPYRSRTLIDKFYNSPVQNSHVCLKLYRFHMIIKILLFCLSIIYPMPSVNRFILIIFFIVNCYFIIIRILIFVASFVVIFISLFHGLLQYIFTDVMHNYIFTTTDYGVTFNAYSVPFTPRLISIHPTNSQLVLGFDENDPRKQVSYGIEKITV